MNGRLVGILLALSLAVGVTLNGLSSEFGRFAQPKPFQQLPEGFRVLTVVESGPRLSSLTSLSGSALLDPLKLESYQDELGIGVTILEDKRSVPEQKIWLETFEGTEVFYSEYLVSGGRVVPLRYAHIGSQEWKKIWGVGLKRGLALFLLGLVLVFSPLGAHKKSQAEK